MTTPEPKGSKPDIDPEAVVEAIKPDKEECFECDCGSDCLEINGHHECDCGLRYD